jgi:hypothetical protein
VAKLARPELSAHLTVGVQIDEADLYVSRKVRASLPNAESLEEDIQRCIHIGLLPAHPDVDIRLVRGLK